MSKHFNNFYFLNCLHAFTTKSKLKFHKKVCENKDFCGVVMPSEGTKMLQFNKYRKFDQTPSIIYVDLESLIKRVDGCKNNFEKLSTAKVGERAPCVCSMSTIWTFDGIEKKHTVYRIEDCMKKFCESLRNHAIKINNLENKKIIPLSN